MWTGAATWSRCSSWELASSRTFPGSRTRHLAGALMGYAYAEIEARLPSIMEFADLGDFIYEPVKNYSSGMYAKLAFEMVNDVEPEALLVDEVFGVGDEFFMAQVRDPHAGA